MLSCNPHKLVIRKQAFRSNKNDGICTISDLVLKAGGRFLTFPIGGVKCVVPLPSLALRTRPSYGNATYFLGKTKEHGKTLKGQHLKELYLCLGWTGIIFTPIVEKEHSEVYYHNFWMSLSHL